ncbi:Nitroreductase-like protein [Aspergillus californicus]
MADQYFSLIHQRRTYYSLSNQSPVTDERIREVVERGLLDSPSSLNGRTSRAVVLLGVEHQKLWDIALQVLKATFPAVIWPKYEQKLNDRKAAYGTILLYEDRTALHGLQTKVPMFAAHIDQFSEHNHAILAFDLWTALELEGFGANLQHFNPWIDVAVAAHWNIPAVWSLKAQLVFRNPTAEPNPNKDWGGQ